MYDYSGIITLFTSGIMLIHYAYYNCSERTRGTINLSFGTIGFGAEAFVFAYVGTSFFSFKLYEWSYELIAFEFVFVLIARFVGTVGTLYVTSFLFRYKKGLTFKEVLFLNFSGVIRGAIAFGLVLRLEVGLTNRSVLITTVLTLVIITTIIFGAIMTLLKTALLDAKVIVAATPDGSIEEEEAKDLFKDNIEMNELLIENSPPPLRPSFSHSYTENKFSTEHANIQNMIKEEKKKKQHACVLYFKRFDEFIMKPLLIYDYDKLSKEKKRPHIVDEK